MCWRNRAQSDLVCDLQRSKITVLWDYKGFGVLEMFHHNSVDLNVANNKVMARNYAVTHMH